MHCPDMQSHPMAKVSSCSAMYCHPSFGLSTFAGHENVATQIGISKLMSPNAHSVAPLPPFLADLIGLRIGDSSFPIPKPA